MSINILIIQPDRTSHKCRCDITSDQTFVGLEGKHAKSACLTERVRQSIKPSVGEVTKNSVLSNAKSVRQRQVRCGSIAINSKAKKTMQCHGSKLAARSTKMLKGLHTAHWHR